MSRISVDENGCWIWTGYRNADGYGRMVKRHGTQNVHRIAYIEFVGPVPDRMCVCHKCDVRACVNPEHLFLGTQTENIADMDSKGRRRKYVPEEMWNTRLTADDVKSIREMATIGGGRGHIRGIAKQFGISRTHVYRILSGNVWKDGVL